MEEDEIIDYIRSNLRRGLSLEETRQELFARGVLDYDLNNALREGGFEEKKESSVGEKPLSTFKSIEEWDKTTESS